MAKDERVNGVGEVDVVADRLLTDGLQSGQVVLVSQGKEVGSTVTGFSALGFVRVDEPKKLKAGFKFSSQFNFFMSFLFSRHSKCLKSGANPIQ